jgi:gamma-butyrobetaine dioxygenase
VVAAAAPLTIPVKRSASINFLEDAMAAFNILARDHSLEVEWPDGMRAEFPWIWLADNEPAAFHPQTEERVFNLTETAEDLRPLSVTPAEEAILVAWPGRAGETAIRLDWLRSHIPGNRRPDPAAIAPQLWRGREGIGAVPHFSAPRILRLDGELRAWLEEIVRYGVSLVDGIEGTPEAGVAIAERIGFLRRTNFGTTFEVISKPDPNNLAYTSQALPLHTDLANQEVPPGYQFLHCIANDAEGGGSVFCDGFAVAEDLRTRHPEAFAVLSQTEIPFRFHDRDTDIRGRFPVIGCGADGSVREIRFNAHLVDIVDLSGSELAAFYPAYRKFMRMLRDPAYTLTLRLSAGEMVAFDNRRVLHGREAFEPATGFRFLSGCYVDRGELLSRIRVLARTT